MTRPRYTLRLSLLTLAILAGLAFEKSRDHVASHDCGVCAEAEGVTS